MGHKQFRITCTDDGQHPSRELARFAPIPPHGENGVWIGDPKDLGLTWADWSLIAQGNTTGHVVYGHSDVYLEDDQHGKTWRFRCKSCLRDVPMTDANLGKLVLGYVEAGFPAFDVSTRRGV